MTSFHEVKVYAASLRLRFPYQFSETEMAHLLNEMSNIIIAEGSSRGMTFLGHLKGIMSSKKCGCIRFNQTVPTSPLDIVSDWKGRSDSCEIMLNCLAYGENDFDIVAACNAALSTTMQRFMISGSIVRRDPDHRAKGHNFIDVAIPDQA